MWGPQPGGTDRREHFGTMSRQPRGRNQLWLPAGVRFTRRGGMRLGEPWGRDGGASAVPALRELRHGVFTTGSCCTGTAPVGRALR